MQKGKRKLVVNEYIYTKAKDGNDGKEIWRCSKRNCKARLHTVLDVVDTSLLPEHNHAPEHGLAEVQEMRGCIKRRSETTEETTRQVIIQSLSNLPVNYAHHLPAFETIARDVRRQRQKNGMDNRNLAEYERTISGAEFLRVREEDMLVFAAQGIFVCSIIFSDSYSFIRILRPVHATCKLYHHLCIIISNN